MPFPTRSDGSRPKVCVVRMMPEGWDKAVRTTARSEKLIWVAWSGACALAADFIKQQAGAPGAEAKVKDEKSAGDTRSAVPASAAPAPAAETRAVEKAEEELAGATAAPADGTRAAVEVLSLARAPWIHWLIGVGGSAS